MTKQKRTIGTTREDENFASLELNTGPTPPLDEVLNGIAHVIETLPRKAKRLWRSCASRRMNVGIEAGNALKAGVHRIPLATLKRVVALGAELEVTIYPAPVVGPQKRRANKRRRAR